MKLTPILALLITVLIVSACTPAAAPATGPGPQPASSSQGNATDPTQVPPAFSNPDEIQQIAEVVQGIGARLQQVSLLSPTAAEDIQTHYADFVAPALLDQWAAEPSQAPGRVTSSPWPDRIEIQSMEKTAENEMVVKGNIIEVTSVEVNSGGAAATIPVEITLQKDDQGKWWITGWKK